MFMFINHLFCYNLNGSFKEKNRSWLLQLLVETHYQESKILKSIMVYKSSF